MHYWTDVILVKRQPATPALFVQWGQLAPVAPAPLYPPETFHNSAKHEILNPTFHCFQFIHNGIWQPTSKEGACPQSYETCPSNWRGCHSQLHYCDVLISYSRWLWVKSDMATEAKFWWSRDPVRFYFLSALTGCDNSKFLAAIPYSWYCNNYCHMWGGTNPTMKIFLWYLHGLLKCIHCVSWNYQVRTRKSEILILCMPLWYFFM